jgi:anti-sigma factor RsiW
MKKCKQYQPELPDYLQKRLSSSEEKEVAGHLLECQSCQEELRRLEATLEMLQKEPEVEFSAGFWSDFAAELRGKIEKKQKRVSLLQPKYVLVPAAAALVLFLAVNLFQIDQGYLARKSLQPEQGLVWLETYPGQQIFTPELEQSLENLSQGVEEIYWQNENLNLLLAELSEEEFGVLEEKVKDFTF